MAMESKCTLVDTEASGLLKFLWPQHLPGAQLFLPATGCSVAVKSTAGSSGIKKIENEWKMGYHSLCCRQISPSN